MTSRKRFVFQSKTLKGNSFSFFQQMRRNKQCIDITFHVGSRVIQGHRMIIAAGIPYFRDKICAVETTETAEKQREIPEIDPILFDALIHFAYSGKITITVENAMDLLKAACQFQIDEVRVECCRFLGDTLHPETMLSTRDAACRMDCPELLETVDFQIRKHFEEVSQTKFFLEIPCSYLKDLISSDNLQVSSEEKVFEAVMRWVSKSLEERSSELPELMRHIRMALLTPSYLWDHVAHQDIIRTSIPCRDLVDEIKSYHVFPEKRKELGTFCTKRRQFMPIDTNGAAIPGKTNNNGNLSEDLENSGMQHSNDRAANTLTYGEVSDGSEILLSVKSIHTKENIRIFTAEVGTELPFQYFDYTINKLLANMDEILIRDINIVTEINGKIYIMKETSTMECDCRNGERKWFQGSGRRFGAGVVIDDDIYLCGGTGYNTAPYKEIVKFSSRSKEWSTIETMPSGRNLPGVVALKGCIYILGGENGKIPYRGSEKYDIKRKTVTTGIPLNTERYALGAAVLNEKIYVCGGKLENNKCSSSVEIFNPKSKKWGPISPMNFSRSKFTLVPYGRKLYAIGGEDDERREVNWTEVYDLQTNKWEIGPKWKFNTEPGVIIIPGPIPEDFTMLNRAPS